MKEETWDELVYMRLEGEEGEKKKSKVQGIERVVSKLDNPHSAKRDQNDRPSSLCRLRIVVTDERDHLRVPANRAGEEKRFEAEKCRSACGLRLSRMLGKR